MAEYSVDKFNDAVDGILDDNRIPPEYRDKLARILKTFPNPDIEPERFDEALRKNAASLSRMGIDMAAVRQSPDYTHIPSGLRGMDHIEYFATHYPDKEERSRAEQAYRRLEHARLDESFREMEQNLREQEERRADDLFSYEHDYGAPGPINKALNFVADNVISNSTRRAVVADPDNKGRIYGNFAADMGEAGLDLVSPSGKYKPVRVGLGILGTVGRPVSELARDEDYTIGSAVADAGTNALASNLSTKEIYDIGKSILGGAGDKAAKGTAGKAAEMLDFYDPVRRDELRYTAINDPVVKGIRDKGVYEYDLGNGEEILENTVLNPGEVSDKLAQAALSEAGKRAANEEFSRSMMAHSDVPIHERLEPVVAMRKEFNAKKGAAEEALEEYLRGKYARSDVARLAEEGRVFNKDGSFTDEAYKLMKDDPELVKFLAMVNPVSGSKKLVGGLVRGARGIATEETQTKVEPDKEKKGAVEERMAREVERMSKDPNLVRQWEYGFAPRENRDSAVWKAYELWRARR